MNSRRNARELGLDRLCPSLRDLDYLVYRERSRILKQWFGDVSETPLRVLDIGGRIQPYRPLLENRLERYIAMDMRFEGLLDVLGDAEMLPFCAESFDVIICTQVLTYVKDPGVAVGEMHRVLRAGGRLFLSTPSFFPEHEDELWRFLPGGLLYLTRHFRSVTVEGEGRSPAGLVRALNIILHTDIENGLARRLAEMTSIPLLNMLGVTLNALSKSNTRGTPNYSLMAVK